MESARIAAVAVYVALAALIILVRAYVVDACATIALVLS